VRRAGAADPRGALKRPGSILGAFAIGYAVARSFCELFREPDPQLGFLWGGLTMGMVLSVPLLLFGVAMIVDRDEASAAERGASRVMTPLEAEIRRIIETDGPISVADYMRLCLGHPQHGYYVTRDPLGARGDFITAPEVSQMFGELIGAWAAAVWRQMGAPRKVRLTELGPGRGTLMADALRAAKAMPEFADALSVHLVETSPVLREAQQAKLGAVNWHFQIEDVPEGPLHRHRERVRRRAAGRSTGQGPRRLAHAHGRRGG
jgi:hypothetical protein